MGSKQNCLSVIASLHLLGCGFLCWKFMVQCPGFDQREEAPLSGANCFAYFFSFSLEAPRVLWRVSPIHCSNKINLELRSSFSSSSLDLPKNQGNQTNTPGSISHILSIGCLGFPSHVPFCWDRRLRCPVLVLSGPSLGVGF